MKKLPPFIGFSAVKDPETALCIARAIPSDFGRKIAIGALVSERSLLGRGRRISDRRFETDLATAGKMFIAHPRVMNIFHVSASQDAQLITLMRDLATKAGPHCQGFQMNHPWPHPLLLRAFRKTHPDKILILQVGRQALGGMIFSPKIIADLIVSRYLPLVNYVVIDESDGRGHPLSATRVRPLLRAIYDRAPYARLGVAGCLGPGTLAELLGSLLQEFPRLSFDAQSLLHSKRIKTDSEEQIEVFDLERALAYLAEAIALCRSFQPAPK